MKRPPSPDYEVISLNNVSVEEEEEGEIQPYVHVTLCGMYIYTEPTPATIEIVEFPEKVVRVVEGERVVFNVKVKGFPEPKLTWYHEGEEVMTNYSTDVGLDGSLSIPCCDTSHTGLYQLVAVNSVERAERQVKLFVRREERPIQEPTSTKVSLSPIPVLDFVEYVTSGHANDNTIFKEQFAVSLSMSQFLDTTFQSDCSVHLLLCCYYHCSCYHDNSCCTHVTILENFSLSFTRLCLGGE